MTEPDFATILFACRWDIELFARALLGVYPHAGQKRFFLAVLKRMPDRFKPAFLTIMVSAGNRAGKTLGLAIVILHSVIYKTGMRPPDTRSDAAMERWLKQPYEWYHFAIQQETSDIVWQEIVRLLGGNHEAQKGRGCPLSQWLGATVAQTDKRYNGDYRWIKMNPVLGGGEIHFRTTGEKAMSGLGKDMNGVSYDEPAFDTNLTFVFNEVLNMRRLSTNGQAILISTPTEGITEFADLWATGDPANPSAVPYRYSMRMSTRDNIGYGIDRDTFDRMVESMPPQLIPQNIDGFFIEGREQYFSTESIERAFVDGLEEESEALPDRRYVQGVDPALTYDSTWSIVVDVTNQRRMVGVSIRRRTGRQTLDGIVALTHNQHNAYTQIEKRTHCTTGIDATGFGGKVFREAVGGINPLISVEFGGRRSTKLRLLSNLKSALDDGRLVFPRTGLWLGLRRQLLGYRLSDRKLEQDAVMALAVVLHVSSRIVAEQENAPAFSYFDVGMPVAEGEGVDYMSVNHAGRIVRVPLR